MGNTRERSSSQRESSVATHFPPAAGVLWHNPLSPKIEEALFSSCGAVACMPWLAASWETPLVRVCIVTVHCILITVISV